MKVVGAVLVVPLLSALTSTAIPIGLRALLCVFWLAAVLRPHVALLALALVVSFSTWFLTAADLARVRLAEALVLATLSGALMAAGRPPRTPLRPQRPRVWPAGLLFSAVVVCSAAVGLAVTQTGSHAPWLLLRSFAVFLARDYLIGPPAEFVGITSAALLVEGIALVFVVSRHGRDGVARPLQLLKAVTAGAGAAAILTIGQHLVAATSLRGLLHGLQIARTSALVEDVNAEGSYFAMAALVALGLASAQPSSASQARSSARWIVPALLLAAVWSSGSPTAIVALLGAGVITAVRLGLWRTQRWSRTSLVAAGLAGALVVAAIAVNIAPRPSPVRTAPDIVGPRSGLIVTGLRTIASAPVFGIGVGRLFDTSSRFMPAASSLQYDRQSAHNTFLQVGGELGLVGLISFVWLLVVAALRLARGLRASPDDRRLAGAAAGLGAFAATWMTSRPLLVPEVAYPFWILLGIALARADGDAQPPLASPASPIAPMARASRSAAAVVVAVAVALALSVAPRARREVATLDLAAQTFGFYDWGDSEIGRARWTSRRATFFISARARELRLPVRALHVGRNTAPTEVSIAIGGRTLHTVELVRDEWTTVRFPLPIPVGDDGYQRVDITTSPAWRLAEVLGQRADVRLLGVQTGEPTLEMR